MSVGKKKVVRKNVKNNIEKEVEEIKKQISGGPGITVFKDIKFKTAKQKELEKTILENQITFVSGPAGTGKSFCSLKVAVELLGKDNPYKKILLTKPIVEGGDSSIGYLKGSEIDKAAPYMSSFLDNLRVLVGHKQLELMQKQELIETNILSFVRGGTFRDCVAILDESQNTTVRGLKLWISRIGETSKLIILGDIDQTDLKLWNNEKNGLEDAITRFAGIDNVGFVEFTEDDIVRSKILIELMKRYKK